MAILAGASVALAFVARHVPKADAALAWTLAAIVALVAGLRTGGFDHEEYMAIVEQVRALADADLTVRAVAAKDPAFLLIIEAAGQVSEDPRLVFFTTAALGMACKVIATAGWTRRRTYLIALYTIFLAPGLEFAAIRTGLAVGVAMLALSMTTRSRYAWMLTAVASHASLVVVALGQLLYAHRGLVPLLMLASAPLVLPWVLAAGEDDPRFTEYLNNPGQIAALAFPVVTLIAWWPLHVIARSRSKGEAILRPQALTCTWLCVLLAIALALPSVTVSFRTLEIGWVLIVAQSVALVGLRMRASERLTLWAALGLMLVMLTSSNVLRSTWAALTDLPY